LTRCSWPRGFEAAGFLRDHANKMATAVAQATIGADHATNAAGRGVRCSAAPKRARLEIQCRTPEPRWSTFEIDKKGGTYSFTA